MAFMAYPFGRAPGSGNRHAARRNGAAHHDRVLGAPTAAIVVPGPAAADGEAESVVKRARGRVAFGDLDEHRFGATAFEEGEQVFDQPAGQPQPARGRRGCDGDDLRLPGGGAGEEKRHRRRLRGWPGDQGDGARHGEEGRELRLAPARVEAGGVQIGEEAALPRAGLRDRRGGGCALRRFCVGGSEVERLGRMRCRIERGSEAGDRCRVGEWRG
jgi:hypothetical protein